MNLPDYYYLSGSNKCGMGYREVNWSLPREQQRIHTRQNIFDGTWTKTPSMVGCSFLSLNITVEARKRRSNRLRNIAITTKLCCDRIWDLVYKPAIVGPRLYDSDATRTMVSKVVTWFKRHRDILESDLIHGRRADGRDLDWMIHVNPELEERALLSVYNPTNRLITKTIQVPLYYAGLSGRAEVSENDQQSQVVSLDPHSRVKLEVTIQPNGFGYFVFRESKE